MVFVEKIHKVTYLNISSGGNFFSISIYNFRSQFKIIDRGIMLHPLVEQVHAGARCPHTARRRGVKERALLKGNVIMRCFFLNKAYLPLSLDIGVVNILSKTC